MRWAGRPGTGGTTADRLALALACLVLAAATAFAGQTPVEARGTGVASHVSAAVGLGPAAGLPTASGGTLRVLSWNVCMGNAPDCPEYHSQEPALKERWVAQVATGHAVDAIFLQEICQSHLAPIASMLGAGWHWAFAARSHGAGTTEVCPSAITGDSRPSSEGQGILVNGAIAGVTTTLLGSDGNQERTQFLCLTTMAPATRLCTTNLSVDERFRREQVPNLLRLLGPHGRLVVGGDLNSQPPDEGGAVLDPLYVRYRECDEPGYAGRWTGQATTIGDAKDDYLFTTGRFAGCVVDRGADSIPQLGTFSDHFPLIGDVSPAPDETRRNEGSGLCLTATLAARFHDPAVVTQRSCSARDPFQRWTPQADGRVRNAGSGLCLDAARAETSPAGAAVQQRGCRAGDPWQRWTPETDGRLRGEGSGLCLDASPVDGGSGVQQRTCSTTEPQQRWT